MSQKRKHTPEVPEPARDIYCSNAIEDRQSTFIGYYSPTLGAKELQKASETKSASHKILAWRNESKQRSLTGSAAQYDVGHDDDGEKYGGKKVESVLAQMRVTGACVVARWYGGVMLGPVRFTHMEVCAREAVLKWQEHEAQERQKKRRVEEESVEQDRLAKTLRERDRSIEVLRAMAAEKEKKVKDALVAGMDDLDGEKERAGVADEHAAQSSPVATIAAVSLKKPTLDYSTMQIDRLKALDKARDATISFLLKRISKAEADLAALGEADKPP